MSFIYKQNYKVKIFLLFAMAAGLCVVSEIVGYEIIPMPIKNVSEYHSNILTINSVISGFTLTNLGILLSIADDQLIKKLEGTDILQKRNIVMGYSMIFGAISIFVSVFWVLKINLSFVRKIISSELFSLAEEFFFHVEILSLLMSIFFFLISIAKMIQLLGLIHVPRRKYSEEQVNKLKDQIFGKR